MFRNVAPDKQEPPRHDKLVLKGGFRRGPKIEAKIPDHVRAQENKRIKFGLHGGEAIVNVNGAIVEHIRKIQARLRADLDLPATGVMRTEQEDDAAPPKRKVERLQWKGLKELRALIESILNGEFSYENRRHRDRSAIAIVTGLEWLGSGNFSNVFALSPTKVLKITKHKNGDIGYDKYAHFAIEHRGEHPCLPRVYYAGTWAGHQVYILERLIPGNAVEDVYSFVEAVRIRQRANRRLTVTCEYTNKAVDLLEPWLKDVRCDNVMVRKDGSLVVTDPYYEYERRER